MKGQLHLQNLLELLIAVIFMAMAGYPILTQVVNTEVLNLQADPQPYTAATIFLLQLVPIAITLGLLGVIWFISIPHQEQQRY
jgi:hypothetical protein